MLMTACSSVLAFGFIPFNLAVYGSHWLPKDTDYSNVIPYSTVFASLTLMAVSGCIGVALNQKCNKVAVHVIRVGFQRRFVKLRGYKYGLWNYMVACTHFA